MRNVVSSVYNAHTDPIFHSLGQLKVEDIFHVQAAKIVKNFFDKNLPPPFSGFFNLYSNAPTTRSQNELDYKTHPISIRRYHRLAPLTIPISWNDIPVNIRNITKLSELINVYKKTLVNKYSGI